MHGHLTAELTEGTAFVGARSYPCAGFMNEQRIQRLEAKPDLSWRW